MMTSIVHLSPKARFIRRISAVSNAIEIIDNEMICFIIVCLNRPRSIYQYSNMALRLSGQNCKFFKFLLFVNSQKRLKYKGNNTKYRSLT